jgi:hypothetical protein
MFSSIEKRINKVTRETRQGEKNLTECSPTVSDCQLDKSN